MSRYFPIFVNMEDKNILVVGGGNIATRRIKTLLQFNCSVTVVATVIKNDIKDDVKGDKLTLIEGEYRHYFLENMDIVLACTDNRELNHSIYLECKKIGNVLVNVCDEKSECDFYFPSVIVDEENVVAVCGNGKSHRVTKKIADNIRGLKEKIFERN